MDWAGISIEIMGFLFLVGVIAGTVDTLAGGGGLITVPALIVSGVPPLAALGTNKLQGCMGTATATIMMVRKKKVNLRQIRPLIIAAFMGSVIGSVAVQFIDASTLSFIIPVVLMIIMVYFIISPKPKPHHTVSENTYQTTVVPGIGFYDGMFGPGTGSFFALAGVAGKGLNLIDATAKAKPLNFATNIASFIVFLIAGQMVWTVGLLMMAGQAIGAWIGSHLLVHIKPIVIRVLVVVMCSGMLIRYGLSMGWF